MWWCNGDSAVEARIRCWIQVQHILYLTDSKT